MSTLHINHIGRTEPSLTKIVSKCELPPRTLPIQRTPSQEYVYGDPGGDNVELCLDGVSISREDLKARIHELTSLVLQKDGKESSIELAPLFQALKAVVGMAIAPTTLGQTSGWKFHNGIGFLLNTDGFQVTTHKGKTPVVETDYYFHPSPEGLVMALADGSIGVERVVQLQEALAA